MLIHLRKKKISAAIQAPTGYLNREVDLHL